MSKSRFPNSKGCQRHSLGAVWDCSSPSAAIRCPCPFIGASHAQTVRVPQRTQTKTGSLTTDRVVAPHVCSTPSCHTVMVFTRCCFGSAFDVACGVVCSPFFARLRCFDLSFAFSSFVLSPFDFAMAAEKVFLLTSALEESEHKRRKEECISLFRKWLWRMLLASARPAAALAAQTMGGGGAP